MSWNGRSLLLSILVWVSLAIPTGFAEVPRTETGADLDTEIEQMIMVGFRGLTVDDQSPIIRDIKERRIRGGSLYLIPMSPESPPCGMSPLLLS